MAPPSSGGDRETTSEAIRSGRGTLADRSPAVGPENASLRPVRVSGVPDRESARLELALAQMPARLRRARRQFQRLTGLTAVTSLASSVRRLGEPGSLSPPVHPLCADLLRTVADPPCEEQWHGHVRAAQSSRHTHSHVCPLGLFCSCVPVFLGGALVGVAKVVANSGTSASDFEAATATLALSVSLSCHESQVSVLRDEMQALRKGVRGSRQDDPEAVAPDDDDDARAPGPGEEEVSVSGVTVVGRALDYLHAHLHEPDLSLREVAAAVPCNGKYLTHRFTQVVGQRMHGYILGLRVGRAGRSLLSTDLPIKQIAFESGFRDAAQLVRVFHRHVGVTPGMYRRIFSGR